MVIYLDLGLAIASISDIASVSEDWFSGVETVEGVGPARLDVQYAVYVGTEERISPGQRCGVDGSSKAAGRLYCPAATTFYLLQERGRFIFSDDFSPAQHVSIRVKECVLPGSRTIYDPFVRGVVVLNDDSGTGALCGADHGGLQLEGAGIRVQGDVDVASAGAVEFRRGGYQDV